MRTYSIPFVAVIVLTIAAMSSAACDNETNGGPLRPGMVSVSGVVPAFDFALSIRPTSLVRRVRAGSLCPLGQPFFAPLELRVENTSRSTVFLNQVGFQFIDSFGVAGPQLTTNQPSLERRFGHVGLPAQSSRVFPFSVEFGCGTQSSGRVNIFVQTIDGTRRLTDRALTAFVH